jgi:hypothetical protein
MNSLLSEIASIEIGVREQGGNNRGPRIRVYQAATWLEPGPWPWCAAFVDWCVLRWLDSSVVRDWLKLSKFQATSFRPRTAGAWDLANWARKNSERVTILGEGAPAEPGDIVLYDFSHVGIIERDLGASFQAIEGNTNGSGDRDSTTGDGVWRKRRERSLARNFLRIHPPRSAAAAPAAIPTEAALIWQR